MSEQDATTETDKRPRGKKAPSDSSSAAAHNDYGDLSSLPIEDGKLKGEDLLHLSTRDLRAFKQRMEETLARRRKAEKAAERLLREETEKKEAENTRKEKAKVLCTLT